MGLRGLLKINGAFWMWHCALCYKFTKFWRIVLVISSGKKVTAMSVLYYVTLCNLRDNITVWRNMPGRLHSYTVEMKAEVFFDTSLTTYQTTRHRIPTDTSPRYFRVKNWNFENFGAVAFFFRCTWKSSNAHSCLLTSFVYLFISQITIRTLYFVRTFLHPSSYLKVCLQSYSSALLY